LLLATAAGPAEALPAPPPPSPPAEAAITLTLLGPVAVAPAPGADAVGIADAEWDAPQSCDTISASVAGAPLWPGVGCDALDRLEDCSSPSSPPPGPSSATTVACTDAAGWPAPAPRARVSPASSSCGCGCGCCAAPQPCCGLAQRGERPPLSCAAGQAEPCSCAVAGRRGALPTDPASTTPRAGPAAASPGVGNRLVRPSPPPPPPPLLSPPLSLQVAPAPSMDGAAPSSALRLPLALVAIAPVAADAGRTGAASTALPMACRGGRGGDKNAAARVRCSAEPVPSSSMGWGPPLAPPPTPPAPQASMAAGDGSTAAGSTSSWPAPRRRDARSPPARAGSAARDEGSAAALAAGSCMGPAGEGAPAAAPPAPAPALVPPPLL
jgi:hypothetical protein